MPYRVGVTRNPSHPIQQWVYEIVGSNNWRPEFVGSKDASQQREFYAQFSEKRQTVESATLTNVGGTLSI